MIKINSLTKEYVMGDNKLLAINNVDVLIKEGEFVSVMGSSGSGKSTLMNIIGCLDTPSSGDYFFKDNNISSLNSNKLAELRNKEIGFVFQNFNLLPRLNALENVVWYRTEEADPGLHLFLQYRSSFDPEEYGSPLKSSRL